MGQHEQLGCWFDSNAVRASISTAYTLVDAISRGVARPFLGHFLKNQNAKRSISGEFRLRVGFLVFAGRRGSHIRGLCDAESARG